LPSVIFDFAGHDNDLTVLVDLDALDV